MGKIQKIGPEWHELTCNFCGNETKGHIYISIRIDLPDPEAEEEFQYTQTDLCKKHWDMLGVDTAFEHNESIREVAGIE